MLVRAQDNANFVRFLISTAALIKTKQGFGEKQKQGFHVTLSIKAAKTLFCHYKKNFFFSSPIYGSTVWGKTKQGFHVIYKKTFIAFTRKGQEKMIFTSFPDINT